MKKIIISAIAILLTIPMANGQSKRSASKSKPKHTAVQTAPKTLPVSEVLASVNEAYKNYDFTKAAKILSDASQSFKTEVPESIATEKDRVDMAQNFLERVEKIVVLDSIAVDRNEFFKVYRIPFSSGYLAGAEALPFPNLQADYVFSNEGNDFKMWAQPDSTGRFNIYESSRLTDGKWSQPVAAPSELGRGADALYPFMMPDGVTLYFASNSNESIGDFDIFIAKRDPSTGKYLQPQNVGMPYNSPYDDYMLAVDELNGIGWWATDRNQLGDKVTVYLYKLNDIRQNYNPEETPNIVDFAKISNYRSTWSEGEDYQDLFSEISQIIPGPVQENSQHDFIFPMPKGRSYTSLSDFRSNSARQMMKLYISDSKRFESRCTQLSNLRKQYAESRSETLKDKIIKFEQELESERTLLQKNRSAIYQAELAK